MRQQDITWLSNSAKESEIGSFLRLSVHKPRRTRSGQLITTTAISFSREAIIRFGWDFTTRVEVGFDNTCFYLRKAKNSNSGCKLSTSTTRKRSKISFRAAKGIPMSEDSTVVYTRDDVLFDDGLVCLPIPFKKRA